MQPEIIEFTDKHYTRFVEAYVDQYAQLHAENGLAIVHLMSRRPDGSWLVHAQDQNSGKKVCVWCGLYLAMRAEATNVGKGPGPALHVMLCDGCSIEAEITKDDEAKARGPVN